MLYERIKELCKQKGVAVTQVERELGFGRGSLSKIDRHTPGYKKLEMIADYFGITVEDITGRDNQPKAETINADFYIDNETAKKAQQVFEAKKILFEAAESSDPEDILTAARFLERMKRTNPYG